MQVIFYVKPNSTRTPVEAFLQKLAVEDRAKVLACLANVQELGFSCPRVQFRQIRGQLWEIKIRTAKTGVRIFYVSIKDSTIVLLHAYKKQSQKAPRKEIEIAEQRMIEVINHEKNYT